MEEANESEYLQQVGKSVGLQGLWRPGLGQWGQSWQRREGEDFIYIFFQICWVSALAWALLKELDGEMGQWQTEWTKEGVIFQATRALSVFVSRRDGTLG